MTTFNHYKDKDIEEKLRQAAGLMPEPTKSLTLSPVMEKRRQAGRNRRFYNLRTHLWRTPAWRIAVIALIIFAVSSTTALTASSKLRTAIARFFSSGITEIIPIDALESEESATVTDSSKSTSDASRELSGNITQQTAGRLKLVQDVTLDSHFTASYVSSPDYLTLEQTPSGIPLFWTQTADDKTSYYSITDGNLEEIVLKKHTLTTAVQLGRLPGIMPYKGNTKKYRKLTLPTMKFTVNWQQYGSDVLIDHTEPQRHFDISSTYGVDLKNDYDGQFVFQALAGQEDIIQVLFCLDVQQTVYQYPFLLNLTTGEVSDPLASVDLSDWACVTELSIRPDLTTATAMAGRSHEDLQEITINLNTGTVTEETVSGTKLPTDDCVTWFSVGNDTLFYVTGTEESGDGYLYNTQNGESTVLFTDTAESYLWSGVNSATRYWESIGYGYLVYYADDSVSLINLQDGGTMTVLEGVPMCQNIDFFVNEEATVLSISTLGEDSFDTARLCLMDLKTMEAWYFDRSLPEGVEEQSHYWNGEYGYVIDAQNTETGTNYIYIYQYTP